MRSDAVAVTPDFIRMCVDERDYQKGDAYERQGRVLSVDYQPTKNGGLFFGEVRGTQREPYMVEVNVIERHMAMPSYTACTCYLNGGCKHVAALLIAAMNQQQTSTVVAEIPQWRKILTNVIGDDSPVATGQAVALMFELREQYTDYRPWAMPPKQKSKPEYYCSIKPVMISPYTQKWIKSGVSWQNISLEHIRPSGRYALSPQQLSSLTDFFNTFRAARTDHSYDESYVRLDTYSSSALWPLLDAVRSSGVKCITPARGNPEVIFHDAATIGVSFRDVKSDVELAIHVVSDGINTPDQWRRFIGKPVVGVYWWTNQFNVSLQQAALHIAPLQVSSEIASLAESGVSVVVPSSDIEAFTKDIYPRLARRLTINTTKSRRMSSNELVPIRAVVTVHPEGHDTLIAKIGFAYDTAGKEVVPLDGNYSEHNGTGYSGKIERDRDEETRVLGVLRQVIDNDEGSRKDWFESSHDGHYIRPTVTLRGASAVHFMLELAPVLRESKDILLVAAPDIPDYSELAGVPEIRYELHETSGQPDWFNLGIEITVDNTTVPFEEVFAALAEDEELLLLPDGSFLRLHHPELDKLRSLIAEARALGDSESGLGLSRFQAGLWEELQKLGVVSQQAAAWDAAVKGLLDVKQIPDIAVPAELKATLRPYQHDGFVWMAFMWQHRLGGILADDMGLGKTVQTIALILHIVAQTPAKDAKPILIVAPTSVSANWTHELENFAPSLTMAYIRQKAGDAPKLLAMIGDAQVVVTSYALFRLDLDAYNSQEWELLVLDEAQFVKNHQSQGYQAARRLNARLKLALTGTPMENNLMELWSLLSIVAPGLFPSPKRFQDFYRKPIEKEADSEKLAQLRQRIRPLMLRRTKDQVVRELPAKIEQVVSIDLDPKHRKIYDVYLQRERQRVLGLLGDVNKNRFMIFKSLTTLRQLSLSAALVDPKKYAGVPSAKLTELLSRLEEILSEGHRVLIFSQFTKYLAMVRAGLDEASISYLYLDGATKNRADLLKQFKTSDASVFVISLKAGGFGLNLTEADYCFLLDPWWNPAVERQAIDRTHRIGQTKQVMVYRFVSKDTIEEKVMALKEKKSKLFSSMLDEGAAFSSDITADDIKGLFG